MRLSQVRSNSILHSLLSHLRSELIDAVPVSVDACSSASRLCWWRRWPCRAAFPRTTPRRSTLTASKRGRCKRGVFKGEINKTIRNHKIRNLLPNLYKALFFAVFQPNSVDFASNTWRCCLKHCKMYVKQILFFWVPNCWANFPFEVWKNDGQCRMFKRGAGF